MNLVLLEPDEVVAGTATIDGRRARHLIEVLRVAPGSRVRAGVIGGAIGGAAVERVGDAAVTLRVTLDEAAPAPVPVDLIVAVPRPKVLTRLIQHAAACAVRRIDLVNAWRVDKSYLGSSRLGPAELGEALRLGAEQGVTTHLPEVAVHPRLMGYLDAATFRPEAIKLIAHARGGRELEHAFAPGEPRAAVMAIGPEGGWIEREVETFAARGFAVVSLGAAILRVEAAVTAALAQLALLRRLAPVPSPG